MTYITKAGEYWDQIAKKIYGDERMMTALLEQNPALSGTFIFDAGVKIQYEEAEAEEVSALPAWRQ